MAQWHRIRDFEELREEFLARAHRVVWCSAATITAEGRPVSRILHPIWEIDSEGLPLGWIGTRPTSPKARDLALHPYVSLAYVAEVATPLYAECEAEWADDATSKQHLWDLFANAPPPLGFDPTPIFTAPDSPEFGVLRLRPWRIQFGDVDGTRRTWLR
jgi:hypothetical protein